MTNSSTISLSEIKSAVLEAVKVQRAIREGRRAHLPPESNTGGKVSTPTEPSRLPPAFLGVCTIDTLTFTLPVHHLGSVRGPAPEEEWRELCMLRDGDRIGAKVEDVFFHHLGFYVGQPVGKGRNFYQDSAPIMAYAWGGERPKGANLGYVAWGGNRNADGEDTMCIHLTGQACESINLQDAQDGDTWANLVAVLQDFTCKITRVDIAYDDLDGDQGGVAAAVGWYKQGLFTNGGRPPSLCQHGNWIDGHGRTLEIGKRENGKLLRIYEKGHQLGDRKSRWVRYELELRSVDRVIPAAALLCLDELLCGSYPAMNFVRCVKPLSVPTIVKAKLTMTLDHLKHHASRAYGRLLNAMQGLGADPADIVASLRVDGLPRRLVVPPSAYA
jgi:DNA relaxase NicK